MKKNILLTVIMLFVCLISVGCTSLNKTKQRADEIVNNYNSGSFDYDTAEAKLNRLLEDVDDYDCEEYIRDQLSLVDKLKISKQKSTAKDICRQQGELFPGEISACEDDRQCG